MAARMVDESVEKLPPLVFSMPQVDQAKDLQILIDQEAGVDEAHGTDEHNTGFVMWPAAVVLSRWIANNPSIVFDCLAAETSATGCDGADILELGAGCGLVGLTAAALLRQHQGQQEGGKEQENGGVDSNSSVVIMTDFNETVLELLGRNAHLNDLSNCTSVVGLDFFDQPSSNTDDCPYGYKGSSGNEAETDADDSGERNYWVDLKGEKHPQVGLILAADIIVYSNDAELVADTIQNALVGGGKALLLGGDENHRFGVAGFEDACRKVGLNVETSTMLCVPSAEDAEDGTTPLPSTLTLEEQQAQTLLTHDLEQSGGYNMCHAGYNLTMFTIDKPITAAA